MLKNLNGVKIEKALLVETLKKVGVMVEVKTHEILTNVLIEVVDNEIIFTAVHQKNHVAIATIENEWQADNQKILVSHKELNTFIKKAKSNFIDISNLDDNKININAGKINYKLQSKDVSNFPIMPVVTFEKVVMDKDQFNNAMKNTCFAVGISESRPILQSVNVTFNSNGLKLVATDSHRLGQYKMDYRTDNTYNSTPNGKMLDKVNAIAGKQTKHVTMGFNESYTLISFDNVEYWIKNTEGNYPDTTRLIPDNFNTVLNVNGSDVLETLSTFELITKNTRNNIITLDNNNYDVELSCKDDENLNKSMDSIVSTWKNEGEKVTINYNAVFFQAALKALNSIDINISITSDTRPFIITSGDDVNALHLILPVRKGY